MALALTPSGIAPKLNKSQLSAICHCGQAVRILIDRHPSAASGTCAVVQISPSKRQCGEQQGSLKAALLQLTMHLFSKCGFSHTS